MLKLVFQSIFLSFLYYPRFFFFLKKQHLNWFSVITTFALLILSNCNWTRTQNYLVRKRTFKYLAKWFRLAKILILLFSLAKWLSVRLRTKWFWVRVQLQSLNGKSVVTERFIRTLKNKIYKDMTVASKNVCIDTWYSKWIQQYIWNN